MTLKIEVDELSTNRITYNKIKSPSITYKIKYYWIGLTNNEIHKYNYLEFRSQVEVLKEKSIAIQSDLFRLNQENERNRCLKNIDYCLDDDIEYMFTEIEKILLKFHKLIWSTRAPILKFINNYFITRNEILYNKRDFFTIEKKLNKVTQIVMNLDVMSEFIKSSVDINDQLMFKVLLLIVNMITLFGQYYWFGNLKKIYCA